MVTDVWSSMGHEGSETERKKTFKPYQITESLLISQKRTRYSCIACQLTEVRKLTKQFWMIKDQWFGMKQAIDCIVRKH